MNHLTSMLITIITEITMFPDLNQSFYLEKNIQFHLGKEVFNVLQVDNCSFFVSLL